MKCFQKLNVNVLQFKFILMQLTKLQGFFDPVKYIFIYNFVIIYVVFEIWLKCTAECTDKHSW